MFDFVKKFCLNCVEKPNIGLAGLFLFLPLLFSAFAIFFATKNLPLTSFLFTLVFELLLLLVSTAGLYLLAYFLKDKSVHGKFLGMLTALSLRNLFNFVFLLLVSLVLFVMLPEFFSKFAAIESTATIEEAISQVEGIVRELEGQNSLNLTLGFGIIIFLSVLLDLLNIYLVYSIIGAFSPQNPKRTLFVLVAFIVFQVLLFVFF